MSLAKKRGEGCLSDLRLEQLGHGELAPEDADAVEKHVAGCSTCRARQQELREDAERFASAAASLETLLARTGHKPRAHAPIRAALSVAGALAAAAALVLVLRPVIHGSETSAGPTRTKGGPKLGFYVRRGSAVFEGEPGQVVFPGDALRFTVSSTAPTHVTVLSVDGAGRTSVYHPQGPPPDTALSGTNQPLSTAIELDESLGTEAIYGVFCERPVSPDELRAALAQDPRAPRFARGCQFERITLVKERP
jgi:hypothetical protein